MQLITGQFNDSFQPVMDGVANVTKNYAYWLNKKYGGAYVVTPAFPQHIDNEEFEVLRYHSIAIPGRPPYRFGMPKLDINFMKRINKIPFDIVHAHCPFTSGQIALQISRKRQLPIVATFHSKFYDDFKAVFKVEQIAQYMVKRVIGFFNSVDVVWTVNKASVDTLRSYGYKGAVDVVYNGTDFTPPEDFNKAAQLINNRLGFNPDELVFLFVGQHIWQKNVKLIIESLHYLRKMGVKFKMVFAGKGYAENDMKEMVRRLHLTDNVQFLGMVLDRDFLKALFCRADLFLFPSVYDNAPIVVREAAAAKCPAVVIEKSNAAEGIVDNYNGFLAKEDANFLALRIKDIVSDQVKLVEVADTAQKTVYKNWESIIDDVAHRYEDIIKTYRKMASGDRL